MGTFIQHSGFPTFSRLPRGVRHLVVTYAYHVPYVAEAHEGRIYDHGFNSTDIGKYTTRVV
jgi:hypothetical protein